MWCASFKDVTLTQLVALTVGLCMHQLDVSGFGVMSLMCLALGGCVHASVG